MTTLKQLCDELEIHPYDAVGDSELADELLEDETDIEHTIFYKEMRQIQKQMEYEQTHFIHGISI